jgi:hypothetical protein
MEDMCVTETLGPGSSANVSRNQHGGGQRLRLIAQVQRAAAVQR